MLCWKKKYFGNFRKRRHTCLSLQPREQLGGLTYTKFTDPRPEEHWSKHTLGVWKYSCPKRSIATPNKQEIWFNIYLTYIYNFRLFGFEGPYVPCGLFAAHASDMLSLSHQNQACRADWCNTTFLPASTLEDSTVMNNIGESIHLIVMNNPGHGTCISPTLGMKKK